MTDINDVAALDPFRHKLEYHPLTLTNPHPTDRENTTFEIRSHVSEEVEAAASNIYQLIL